LLYQQVMSNSDNHPLFESLESRTLFAVSPTVQADLDQIALDRQTLANDRATMIATLNADRLAIRNDRLTSAVGDPALIQKLKDDKAAYLAKTQQDRTNLFTTLKADRDLIAADLLTIRADAGNIPAVAADRLKLFSDRAKMVADVQAYRATLVQDRSALHTTLFDDLAAIAASKASPNLATDQAKLVSDTQFFRQTLINDTNKLIADRVKLGQDIRAGL